MCGLDRRLYIAAVAAVWSVASLAQSNSAKPPEPMFVCSPEHPAAAGPCATPAHSISILPPHYPDSERDSGVRGTVILSYVVGTDGVPHDIEVVQSLGKAFDEAAVRTVKQWGFAPGTYEGRPVPVRTKGIFNFRLVGSAPQRAAPAPSGSNSSDGQAEKLVPINVQKPAYPVEAAREGIQGRVWLKLLVGKSGEVKHVDVISGDPVLAKAAIKAAKRWTFEPFIRNGEPLEVSTEIPFDFAFKGKITDTPASLAADIPPDNGGARQPMLAGEAVSRGLLIHMVQPAYPESARQNHIEGTVVLRTVIDKDGNIRELTPLSGPKELIGAVEQWRYKLYTLNDRPVEVETRITVNFRLPPI